MSLFFDAGDREMLSLLDSLREGSREAKALRRSLDPFLHPRGIKELGSPRELRIAGAMISLLKSLEEGKPQQRLQALRSVRDEALANEQTSFKLNAARALLQIMKELVRCRESARRLELAHEFRLAMSGKPRVVRAMLASRKLLELPEDSSQIAFDEHVHDAHTKGRKTSTHLVMDAWIKGMRSMTVIYYNAVSAEAARELLEAGSVMGLKVKIGIELAAPLSCKTAHLIWIPRGFEDSAGFLEFLRKPAVRSFMEQGEAVNRAASLKVLASLDDFNKDGRLRLSERYGVELPEISRADFELFVAGAPASRAHMAELVHAWITPMLAERAVYLEADSDNPKALETLKDIDSLDAERISDEFLPASASFQPDPPWHGPEELLALLRSLPSGFRMTLNMSGLDAFDALEVVWRCKGSITHVEAFNLKDYLANPKASLPSLCELRRGLNSSDAIRIKALVLDAFKKSSSTEQAKHFNEMLHSLPQLSKLYAETHLGVRIGSDSTERSRSMHGMGFAVVDTLPSRTQAALKRDGGDLAKLLPVKLPVRERIVYAPREAKSRSLRRLFGVLAKTPLLKFLAFKEEREFIPVHKQFRFSKRGNVVALGSMVRQAGNGFIQEARKAPSLLGRVLYLNSTALNVMKALCGFVPAFITFLLTKDWWLLAYFGAFIWFGITGLRNILMSVLGGGGVFRSPLLPWTKLVNWDRLADSLMYTGFAVPLLDYFVKTVLLDRGFGVTVATSPIAVYSTMAVANGFYLVAHNSFRGFAPAVMAGNFFRSLLSIPLAWAFNFGLFLLLGACGVPAPAEALQKWAAIISKAASDCVAGLIEGSGDRFRNIKLRLDDYAQKRAQLFDLCARIETLFPETSLPEILKEPGKLAATLRERDRAAWRELAIHSLDLLHIYWRKPRAQAALKATLDSMDSVERRLFIDVQVAALAQTDDVAKLLQEVLGFGPGSAPMRLYREYAPGYIDALKKLRSA